MNSSVPAKPKFGVYVNVPSTFNTTAPFAAPLTKEDTSASPSTSTSFVLASITMAVLDAAFATSSAATGASFTAVTVMFTVATFEFAMPSFTRYVN